MDTHRIVVRAGAFLVGAAALLAGPLASAAPPAPAMIEYPSGGEKVAGYLALPPGGGRHPAIVVVHEWWGLNDFAKGKARALADAGYVALAIDLYRGKSTTDPDVAHQIMRGLPEDRAARDLRAAFDLLAARPDVDKARIGVVGWCMGGGYALQMAIEEPSLAAAVIYYGRLVTDGATIAKIKAPLLGNFGADDQGIPPESVKQFEAAARKAGVRVDFKVYPKAGHGFASRPDSAGSDAAKDADARTAAFFARTLGSKE